MCAEGEESGEETAKVLELVVRPEGGTVGVDNIEQVARWGHVKQTVEDRVGGFQVCRKSRELVGDVIGRKRAVHMSRYFCSFLPVTSHSFRRYSYALSAIAPTEYVWSMTIPFSIRNLAA